jgi:hypothetical protein
VEELFIRPWQHLLDRIGGPLSFRLAIQPTVSTILAIRAGWRDAREGQPPYFWTILSNRNERYRLLRAGWKDIGEVFVFAAVLDLVYQLIVHRWLYPIQALILSTLVAIIPYLLFRGPVNRIARRYRRLPETTAAEKSGSGCT